MSIGNEIVNIQSLIQLRIEGLRPPIQFVFFGDGGRLRGCEVGVNYKAPIERLDLRPFIALDVLVIAKHYSGAVVGLCQRMSDYATTTSLSVIDWLPDDLGLVWHKGCGQPREFGAGPLFQREAA